MEVMEIMTTSFLEGNLKEKNGYKEEEGFIVSMFSCAPIEGEYIEKLDSKNSSDIPRNVLDIVSGTNLESRNSAEEMENSKETILTETGSMQENDSHYVGEIEFQEFKGNKENSLIDLSTNELANGEVEFVPKENQQSNELNFEEEEIISPKDEKNNFSKIELQNVEMEEEFPKEYKFEEPKEEKTPKSSNSEIFKNDKLEIPTKQQNEAEENKDSEFNLENDFVPGFNGAKNETNFSHTEIGFSDMKPYPKKGPENTPYSPEGSVVKGETEGVEWAIRSLKRSLSITIEAVPAVAQNLVKNVGELEAALSDANYNLSSFDSNSKEEKQYTGFGGYQNFKEDEPSNKRQRLSYNQLDVEG